MHVARVMKLLKVDNDLRLLVRWKGLIQRDDTPEPLENVYQDVTKMFERLLARKYPLANIAQEARDALDF